MKAVLLFADGTARISQVTHLENAAGDIFVLDRISVCDGDRGKVEFGFEQISVSGGREVAEYRELELPARPLPLGKSG